MTSFERLIEVAKSLGMDGRAALDFAACLQKIERDVREAQRLANKEAYERKREEKKKHASETKVRRILAGKKTAEAEERKLLAAKELAEAKERKLTADERRLTADKAATQMEQEKMELDTAQKLEIFEK